MGFLARVLGRDVNLQTKDGTFVAPLEDGECVYVDGSNEWGEQHIRRDKGKYPRQGWVKEDRVDKV